MKYWILIIFLILFAGSAQAATRYVDPVCPNAITIYNPTAAGPARCAGGSATVYTTIANGVAATQAGDTLLIRGGTYAQSINWPANGSSGAPTIISRYQNETVNINPPNGQSLTAGGSSPQWITFIGLIVDGTSSGSNFVNGFGVCCHYTANIVFSDGEIRNFGGNGAEIFAESITIRNTRVHHNGSNTTLGPGHGIYSACHSGCVFEDNEVYNNDHYGIHIYDSGASNVSNHIVRRNRVYSNAKAHAGLNQGGFGILLSSGSNNVAYNNVIYDNGASDLSSGGIAIKYGCSSCIAYNNTIYGHPITGIEIFEASTTTVKNNIIWSNGSSITDSGSNSGIVQDHNLCNSGCTGTGSINGTDPLFTDAGANNFILLPASLAINVGTTNIAPGITIPACSGGIVTGCYNGTAPDLGALETGVPTAGGGPPTLTPNLTNVAAGQEIKVTVDDDDVNERTENTGDYVGLYIPGATSTGFVDWFYMNNTKTAPATAISDAVLTFTAPATQGTYEFRFYQNGSTLEADRLTTATFTVIPAGIVMKFSVSSLKVGPSVTWKVGTP